MIAVHFGDLFVQFTPIGASKSTKQTVRMWVKTFSSNRRHLNGKCTLGVVGKLSRKGTSTSALLLARANTICPNVKPRLRAPAPDTETGMLPLCRETFSGDMTVSMYKIDKKNIRIPVFENASSGSTACLEVGGGPWEEPWEIQADVRDPLAGVGDDGCERGLVQSVGKVFGLDVIPGL